MSGGRVAGGGLGLILVALAVWALGGNPFAVLQQGNGLQGDGGGQVTHEDERWKQFVSVTLADTEEVWSAVFRQLGRTYHPPVLVLFKDTTRSACGGADAQTGPFYCPTDGKIYLDTDFFDMLSRRLGAKGDFAAAYVVAHEVGHRVQDELGILQKTDAVRAGADRAMANAISVRVELQADCFVGVRAQQAQAWFDSLEPGDIAEAMRAAGQIGDDTLQKNAGRRPMPDSFTHGSSAQRQRWFAAGYDAKSLASCDTFSVPSP